MADDDDLDDVEDDLDDEDGEGSSGKKGGKKKLIIFGAVGVLLLLVGSAAAYFTGLLDPLVGGGEKHAAEDAGEGAGGGIVDTGEAVFYDLEDIMVNLNTTGRKSTYLKIRISLELPNSEDIPKIEAVMPRIVDNFQVYLRELRVEDLKGSAGMYRLREELLTRVAAAAAPARVSDVLFKEMLVQ
jgi:flagellar protein FliL